MAVTKSHTVKSGFEINHWEIEEIRFDLLANLVIVQIAGYKDASAKSSGKDPALRKSFNWIPLGAPSLAAQVRVAVEAKLLEKLNAEELEL